MTTTGADRPGTGATASVSTHVLDTSAGRPAAGITVSLATQAGSGAPWVDLGGSRTGRDGRCADLPALPEGTVHVRLTFDTGAYHAEDGRPVAPGGDGRPFFPEVTVTFAVTPGEHYHVPLLLNPYGYAVYRGS